MDLLACRGLAIDSGLTVELSTGRRVMSCIMNWMHGRWERVEWGVRGTGHPLLAMAITITAHAAPPFGQLCTTLHRYARSLTTPTQLHMGFGFWEVPCGGPVQHMQWRVVDKWGAIRWPVHQGWFRFAWFALLLEVVLCWVGRCFGSWVLLGSLCILRVTPGMVRQRGQTKGQSCKRPHLGCRSIVNRDIRDRRGS